MTAEVRPPLTLSVDVAVVGAGFAGMYMLHRLRGLGLSAVVFEAGSDVGGTWYWNRYPGARCDVESMQYSYSFDPQLQQDWHWSERYATQPEILRYAQHVADRYDLRRDIQFNTRVTSQRYDEATASWTLRTDRGDVVQAKFCVMATGLLSTKKLPEIPGVESFAGPAYHTAAWPHQPVDFTGQRVGVIGTGSSGIQAIPQIAKQAAHVTVFQRTPNYSVPAHNWPMREEYEREWKANYPQRRRDAQIFRNAIYQIPNDVSALAVDADARQRQYEARWEQGGTLFMGAFNDLILNKAANDTAADFVRAKIRGIVKDPAVAEMLAPSDYAIGTKRICVDTDYYATYNRDNVTVVDVQRTPIAAIEPDGVRTQSAKYHLDCLVYATGFDALTGTLLAMDITGRDGLTLREAWAAGPRSYLGLMVAGFPNLFIITGPGSPSALTNLMVSIEQHVDWIADCLVHLRARGARSIEATIPAQDEWVAHSAAMADRTLFPHTNSWYLGANVPGKPRVMLMYMGGFPQYKQHCDASAAAGYKGFAVG